MAFTPIHTALGGLLLHLSTSSLLSDSGRVLGISGVLDGALLGAGESWRWALITGLLSGPSIAHATGLYRYFPDQGGAVWAAQSIGRLSLAGFLVGFGAKVSNNVSMVLVEFLTKQLGSGCTSGHLLCGTSRLSLRSILATGIFFASAVMTANLSRPVQSRLHLTQLPDTLSGADIIVLSFAVSTIFLLNRFRRRLFYRLSQPPKVVRLAPYFLAGAVFSLGLGLSGMVSPLKVLSFLYILPPWHYFDPSLVMVVLTGVLPNMLHWLFTVKKQLSAESGEYRTRYSWESWQVPNKSDIDMKLVLGAAVFGVGWGLGGVCPGPAITGLGQMLLDRALGKDVFLQLRGWVAFAGSLVLGMRLARTVGI